MPYPTYRKKSVQATASDSKFSYNVSNRSRVSFVPITIEYVGWFDVNAIRSSLTERYQVHSRNRALKEVAGNLAFSGSAYGDNTGTSFQGRMFQRNYSAEYNIGTPRSGNVYSSVSATSQGIPYDLYVDHRPLSVPQGVPGAFYNTEDDPDFPNNQFDGANCVGIISARNKVFKSGGGVLNITTNQRFGEPGDIISFGGGNPTLSIIPIGGGVAFGGSTNLVPPTRKYIPIWGSNSDSIESFGGFSLHAVAWDAWPDCLTVFVPQYFAVMHFNPGVIGSTATEIEYDGVDFRVPPNDLSIGTQITKDTEFSVPYNQWPINTSLRGLMVTDNVLYVKKTITFLSSDSSIESKGAGYRINDEIENTRYNVTIKITAVDDEGGVTGWEFLQKEISRGITETQDGEDLSNIFPVLVTFPTSASTATLVIQFNKGAVRQKYKLFLGPKKRSNIIRLTLDSEGDKGRIDGTKRTTLELPNNIDAPEPGEYEIFYLFHSDAGASWKMDQFDNVGEPELRYVTVEIA